ncbi:hypothetical protein [Leucobacter sp. NPDC077196]|uniref:hypothetical protein n=1 Tax=Leucobacter sp. NPDC077196 TaxID=3154959 RepID=UPI0034221306
MILGIDFSLTATGVCAIEDSAAECITIRSKKEDGWWEFPSRVENIACAVDLWRNPLGLPGPAQLVIETPAFAAKSASLDRMFGGWWMFVATIMRDCLYEPPLLVTPSQVKKFATGKGNAGKDEVMLAVSRRYPAVEVTDNNQTDALVLAAIGAAVMGEPFSDSLTKGQQEVVEAVRLRGEVS